MTYTSRCESPYEHTRTGYLPATVSFAHLWRSDVMFLRVYDLFHRHAGLFNGTWTGDPSLDYALPTVVEVGEWRLVLNNREQVRNHCARYRALLQDEGIVSVTARVGAVELPRNGRFRVWVNWVFDTAAGPATGGSQVIYYLRTENGRHLIEMSEFTRPSAATRSYLSGARAA